MRIDGLILAGGKSRRMGGKHKGNLLYGQDTFMELLIKELGKKAEQIWISYGKKIQTEYENCTVVVDEYPDCGPLGGLHAGLKNSEADVVLVAACDMPFLKIELYQFLLSCLTMHDQGVIPIVDGRSHPLAAVYRTELETELQKDLQEGNYKLQRVMQQKAIRYVDVSEKGGFRKMLNNINTLEDYAAIKNEE